jgi:hydroxymethylbilane synthase
MSNNTINIGTRKSILALWQSNYVANLIRKIQPEITINLVQINTLGDTSQDSGRALPEIGGKGLFTAELEEALDAGKIDLAVHSLKDLPTDMDAKFAIAAVPKRDNPFDVLVSRNGEKLKDLPKGAVVGTSSLRRVAQLKRLRPDLETLSIRGNVDTRLKKVSDSNSGYQAAILAAAGLTRLGYDDKIAEVLDMLPAPAQGALGIQTRAEDLKLIELLDGLHDEASFLCVAAERAFLSGLNAGCSTPVAAFAEILDGFLHFKGRVLSVDGAECIDVKAKVEKNEAVELGRQMALLAKEKGADRILSSYGTK